MIPIPETAMPVVKVLRRDVLKPKSLPVLRGKRLRWPPDFCPMGLHLKSYDMLPVLASNFANSECSQAAVEAFWRWWDQVSIEDAQEAVNAIWGKD